jgi:UBX domain-containing protein 1
MHVLSLKNLPLKPQAAPAQTPTNHIITFYRNGIFVVDDGPPRRVDDRANFQFIDTIGRVRATLHPSPVEGGPHPSASLHPSHPSALSISSSSSRSSQGECPEELEAANPGVPVTVNLVKKDEDYKEPEKPK